MEGSLFEDQIARKLVEKVCDLCSARKEERAKPAGMKFLLRTLMPISGLTQRPRSDGIRDCLQLFNIKLPRNEVEGACVHGVKITSTNNFICSKTLFDFFFLLSSINGQPTDILAISSFYHQNK